MPFVIENVKDAGPEMVDPLGLCGCMFDLSTVDTDGVTIHLQRLRMFETNWGLTVPARVTTLLTEWVAGAYGGARRDNTSPSMSVRAATCPARSQSCSASSASSTT